MAIIEPRVLKGFRDTLPPYELKRQALIAKLANQFRLAGFLPIDTPALEYTEVLLGKGSGETDKQIYRFQDHGKRDVALRFDLTVPFARFMAKNGNSLHLPFKRYHIDKVWRGENTQKGRYREFYQCDFDMVGSRSISADYEILNTMHDAIRSLGIERCTIKLNHRGIFNLFLERLEIKDKSVEILRLVDKIHKIGENEVLRLLTDLIGEEKGKMVLQYISCGEDFETTLAQITELAGGENEHSTRLASLYRLLQENGKEKNFQLDPSITRGLDYYTGIVYETFLDDLPSIGSVCSGGRYDNLASLYTKSELPGVGSSIGLDRLMAAMEELESDKKPTPPIDLLIFFLDEELLGHYHSLADTFRKAGFRTEVFHQKAKFDKQFKFADAKGVKAALICGSNEFKEGLFNLRILETKENIDKINVEKAIEILRKN